MSFNTIGYLFKDKDDKLKDKIYKNKFNEKLMEMLN
jgi:hypothetical protein